MSGRKPPGNDGMDKRSERFADLMDEDTVPLADRDRQHTPSSKPPTATQSPKPQPAVPQFQVEPQERGARAEGFSRSDFAKLQRGEFPVEREVDLHGLSAPEAKTALEACLSEALRSGERCVMAIHGRGLHSSGDPVLRSELPGWLTGGRFASKILAFTPAPRRLGGVGATLVKLRRQR